ncbi:adhesion G-protein coupled receptor G2-like [Anarrhichthys ocellatus]|uniref:adhesion G-protein coupled receptor G2-like n=1 Tax=Anarrhichthys ocellatus TaxID=433405 RepID=UPI0012ECD917|nr:adhesion G-protein coupled receptor G2-like [Anarrhichthys ocellatus]
MLPLDVKHCWMFVAILFFGILVKNSICECSDADDNCRQQKNLLIVNAKKTSGTIPSESVYYKVNGSTICVPEIWCGPTGCSDKINSYRFDMEGRENNYNLTINEETLSQTDIVLMNVPDDNFDCMKSELNNTVPGFLWKIHNCSKTGNKSIRLSQNGICREDSPFGGDACGILDDQAGSYKFIYNDTSWQCLSCYRPTSSLTTTSPTTTPGTTTPVAITVTPPENNNGFGISPENAASIMKNLSHLLEEMGNSSTAAVTIGHIKGGITKLLPNASDINIGITANGNVIICENIDDSVNFSRLVQIPTEASAMALKRNSSFAGVLLFPGMHQDDPNSSFLNDELLGIEMGTEISNLSQTIDIHYRSVDKNGSIASCRSWDGKGKSMTWITDGCQTKETNNSIICQCSHLTFFAILMSPPPGNISASDFTSLTYITSIGCGLSIFFLMVALFMHFLIRKGKASQATKILMNLFVAMFTLNFSFLVNESIAELGNFGACVAVAAVMHYTMLATCTWFFIEALHLYLNLWKTPTDKHYMAKICTTGWVTPAVVVIPLLALRQYDYLVIYTDDGNTAKMCWISDAVVHQGVNVGYYAVVFIFTFVIFIMTVRQIVLLKPTAGKSQHNSSTKANSFSIFGLFVLLGITWGFAFFSHGPLLIASYYLFTILNSFQGFFLFIYYVNSSKNRSPTGGISSTATSDTVTQ